MPGKKSDRGVLRQSVRQVFPLGQDRGVVTLIISIAALLFSLGTLVSDVIRNRNLLLHDLQVDGQVFHRTLVRLDTIHCSPKASLNARCDDSEFFIPSSNSRGREILLQRAEYLESRIEALLRKLDMPEFGYITPVDYRTLAKEELRDLNFEKSRNLIDKEVKALSAYKGHPGYVLRTIHADLINGWYQEILSGKNPLHFGEDQYFSRAVSKAESQIAILPVRNYMVVFILQQEGCAQWMGESLFYARFSTTPPIRSFGRAHAILENEPLTVKILASLRANDQAFSSGEREGILSSCIRMFDKI